MIIPHSRTVLHIWADSCLVGGGAEDGSACYAVTYSPSLTAKHHITQLEAINVLAAVRTFVKPAHAAGTVEVYCDNSASLSPYTSGRARDEVLAAASRAMWYHAAATQTILVFAHVPGEAMVLPDALSREALDPKYAKIARDIIASQGMSKIPINMTIHTPLLYDFQIPTQLASLRKQRRGSTRRTDQAPTRGACLQLGYLWRFVRIL